MREYISYLGEEFDTKYIATQLNLNFQSSINKPLYGLWASPVNAKYGWKEFCINNLIGLDPVHFRFTLKYYAKIFYIDNLEDVEKLPFYGNGDIFIDFDKLREDGYDGMELTNPRIGHYFISKKEECFNSWDCESIVIWNPDIIVPIE